MPRAPEERPFEIRCDDLSLRGSACIPERARGVAVLFHGIPSVAPAEEGDPGYSGLARSFAAEGWAAAWADLRAARSSPGCFSIEGWVRDALAMVRTVVSLDGLDELPVCLIGSSAGGAIAAAAVRRGAPAQALVLLAAPADWSSFAADPWEGVRRIREEGGMRLSDETLADPTEWASEFERVATEECMRGLELPALIVHGSEDHVVPLDHARRIAAAAPRARLAVIEKAGHQLRRDPTAMRIVLEWLRETFP